MYCPKCGKMIKDGAAFCVYCGNRVEDIGKTESEGGIENTYTLKNQHFKYFAAVAAILVILIVSLALILPELEDWKKDNDYSKKTEVSESDFKDMGEEKADVSESVFKDSEEKNRDEEKPNPASSRFSFDNGYKKGDIITFGEYEQDGDTSNGPEPIEWEVLDNGSDGMLVISRYILDAKPYNEEFTDVTWETCTLRKWLNDEFYNDAFSPDERSRIKETLVKNDDNERWGTEGGNDTRDKVFLLSVDEVFRYYDFNVYDEEKCYGLCEKLISEGTKYALDNGLFTHTISQDDYDQSLKKIGYSGDLKEIGYSGECVGLAVGCWWLRSPGVGGSGTVCYVDYFGYAGADAYYGTVHAAVWGLRPALYLEK